MMTKAYADFPSVCYSDPNVASGFPALPPRLLAAKLSLLSVSPAVLHALHSTP
jgi:hypothetical protein